MSVVLALVILFGMGQFFAIPPASQQAPSAPAEEAANATKVIAYVPPELPTSTKVLDGSCWTSSIAAPFRKDAWRCAVQNAISDPCFEIPGGKELVCGMNPAVARATSTFLLKLTKPLPAPETVQGAVPSNWAWLAKLSDGTICSPFTGTLPVAEGGISANYGCAPKTKGGEGLLIFGDFNASTSEWTALVGTLAISTSGMPRVSGEHAVAVDTVWQ